MFNFNNIYRPDSPSMDQTPAQIPWGVPGQPDPRIMQASFQQPVQQNVPVAPVDALTDYRQQNGMQTPPVDTQRQGMATPEIQHLNDVLTQYTQNKQDQRSGNNFLSQILSNRFQPESVDTTRSILNSAVTNTYNSPETEMALRYKGELSPYTDVLKAQSEAGNSNTAQSGGATGILINRLMADNPGMSFSDAMYRTQTGFRQGQGLGPNGNIVNLPGAIPAAAAMAGGKQTAVTTATNTAQNTVNAQNSLPQSVDNAEYMKKLVGGLVSDPALEQSVGMYSYMPVVRGTPRADFMNRLSQTQSDAFLQAFNNLRGGGQISNVEGEKATSAINRMNANTSPAEFRKAAQDFLSIVDLAVQRTKNSAGGNPAPASTTGGQPVGATHIFNPNTGQLEPAQ